MSKIMITFADFCWLSFLDDSHNFLQSYVFEKKDVWYFIKKRKKLVSGLLFSQCFAKNLGSSSLGHSCFTLITVLVASAPKLTRGVLESFQAQTDLLNTRQYFIWQKHTLTGYISQTVWQKHPPGLYPFVVHYFSGYWGSTEDQAVQTTQAQEHPHSQTRAGMPQACKLLMF